MVQEKEHDVFKRKGSDLITTMDLELTESLWDLPKLSHTSMGVSSA